MQSQIQFLFSRIGEQLAYNWLKRHFSKLRCKWMNEFEESGNPYDFKIYDEHDRTVRYVEVKTSVRERGRSVNQWLISRKEMHFAAYTASMDKSQYSCFLIHMTKNIDDGKLAPKSITFVNDLLVDLNGQVVQDSLLDFTVRIATRRNDDEAEQMATIGYRSSSCLDTCGDLEAA